MVVAYCRLCRLGTSKPPDTFRLFQRALAPESAYASVPSWRLGTGEWLGFLLLSEIKQ